MSVFTGIWVPLVTPFADGAIDHRALRKLVDLYGAAGVSGLVALGTTGEAAALERSEQAADHGRRQARVMPLGLKFNSSLRPRRARLPA